MTTAVLIPWRETDDRRARLLAHVVGRLRTDGHDVFIGEHTDGPWCKSLAIAAALDRTDADVLILHDADVIIPGLPAAIEAVASGAARWAVPHGQVRRLDERSTDAVLAGGELRGRLSEAAYYGHAGGGCSVIGRADYEACPLDPRFLGWGRDDDAACLAWTTLYGPPWRGTEPLWHLWHKPQERANRKYGSDGNNALYRRYHEATGRGPDAMRALVDEAKATTRHRA